MKNELTIFSYSRIDSEFVLKLAKDLRNSHANIWLDQLDIEPGSHWDQAIENAMKASKCVIVVLSPNSINSYNVMDEVSYAIEEGKRVVPILFKDCSIPLRIRRLQYIDFRINYALSFDQLIKSLHLEEEILPEPGKTDSEIKQNEVEPLHKAEEEERQRLDQIKAEVQRKAKEEKEKLKQIKAEAQHKAEDEKEKLKQLKAEDHRKTEEEKKKRAVESESLLNQPSTGSENGPPETILIKISKIIRKKPIILYIGILSLLIIILAGYFIFKPKHPIPGPFGTIPEPSKYDTLATITNLVDQKKLEEAKQIISTLPIHSRSRIEYIALINRIRESDRVDSLKLINKNIDLLISSASQLYKIGLQSYVNKNCPEAKRKYSESLSSYKKVLAIDPQNIRAKIEIQKITNILDTICMGISYQFSVRRYPAYSNIKLTNIRITDNETIITLQLRPTSGSLIVYGPGSEGAFIIEYNNRTEYLKLKSVRGIQTGQSFNLVSNPKSFQLIFNRLPDNVHEFNLLEGENQDDDTQSHWNIIGIELIK